MSIHIGLLKGLREGQNYLNQWPNRKELLPLFPEQRVIDVTRFSVKVMPAVACISVLSQVAFQNYGSLPQALAVGFFALTLPLQGFWWLGNRAHTPLPPSLAKWYRELHQKMLESGQAMEPMNAKPRYKELAKTLKRAFSVLDDNALSRWF